MTTSVLYASREQVKAALDVADTARVDAQIDRLIAAASRSIEGLCHRRFYPELGTRYFQWPDDQMGRAWRLWLNQHELISISALVSGGTTITDYFLEPNGSGPPYNRIEINLAGPAAFSAGPIYQRAVAVTGVFGYGADTAPAGQLAAPITSTSATSCAVTDSAAVGVGDLLLVDAERMKVTGKSMLATGQTLQGALAAARNAETLAVTTGSAFAVGETLLLEAERMLVVDIAGNTLVVKRAHDGSTLGAHSGSPIYAARTLTVERGVLGTTAATHLIAAPLARHQVPELVGELAVAETLVGLGREQSGYARMVGSGESARPAPGGDIKDLRAQVYQRYGRKVRQGRA